MRYKWDLSLNIYIYMCVCVCVCDGLCECNEQQPLPPTKSLIFHWNYSTGLWVCFALVCVSGWLHRAFHCPLLQSDQRAGERGHMFGRSIRDDGTLGGGSRSIGEFRSITEWRGGFGGMERNSE